MLSVSHSLDDLPTVDVFAELVAHTRRLAPVVDRLHRLAPVVEGFHPRLGDPDGA